jgi:hypothetical protein
MTNKIGIIVISNEFVNTFGDKDKSNFSIKTYERFHKLFECLESHRIQFTEGILPSINIYYGNDYAEEILIMPVAFFHIFKYNNTKLDNVVGQGKVVICSKEELVNVEAEFKKKHTFYTTMDLSK